MAKERTLGNSLVVLKPSTTCVASLPPILTVVTWDRECSEPQFRNGIQCDAWK